MNRRFIDDVNRNDIDRDFAAKQTQKQTKPSNAIVGFFLPDFSDRNTII